LINDQITDSKESRIRPFIASGTNTYTVSIPYVTSYLFGLTLYVQFSNANSGTSTINITGASGSPLGAKTLKKSVLTDLVTGDILAGEFKELWYDGTNFQVRGAGGGGGAISGLTPGRVTFATSGTTIGDDAGLFWNNASKNLGVGTSSPDASYQMHILGNGVLLEATAGTNIVTRFKKDAGQFSGFDFYSGATRYGYIISFPDESIHFTNNADEGLVLHQNGGISINGITSPNASTALDIQGTTKAFKLGTATRASIVTPVNGMLTTDTNVPYFHNGTAWSAIPTAPTALGTSLQVFRTNAGGTATEWATISGGITNTAANNELMMSNGTNAVPSGVFADATGNLNLGTSLSGATRTISATGSATDIGLALQSKGSSAISFTGGGSNYQFGTGGFNFSTSGLAITGINTIQSGNTTTLNLLTPPQSGATNGTNVVIFTGDVVTGTSGNVNIYTGSNSGGTEGAVNIQTRATGKLGFFNATAVVKQSAVSTSQGIADVLTAYGLLPSSTISSGGTYYAPSTLVANATDANFTATLNGVHNILDGVASANRVITIPTGANGDVMKFYNTEDTRVWSFTGATVYLADRVTVVTELLYNVPCHMERIDGRWIITN
jgi:hypothetical protein